MLTCGFWRSRLPIAVAAMVVTGCATSPTSTPDNQDSAAKESAVKVGAAIEESDKDGADDAEDVTLLPSGSKDNYAYEIDAPRAFATDLRRRTLVGRWQRRKDYDPIQFDGLVARLKDEAQAILQAEGYYQARVSVESSPGKVKVAVVPGPRVSVGRIDFGITGPGKTDPVLADISGLEDLAPGRPFRSAAWQSDKRAVIDAMNRQGYLRAEIKSSEARVDVGTGKADLELEVDSGSRLVFGEVVISGLERYDRSIIEDVKPFAPGQPYTDAKLQEFQARLRTAGYFSSISALPDLIELQRDPLAVSVPIQVIVSELQRRRVAFGIGFSTDEGLRGQVGLEDRDIFGTGLRMESAVILSARRQRTFANFRTPYDENNRYYGFGQRLEREDIQDLVTLRSNTYAGIGRREGDIDSFTSLQFQLERERIPAGPAGPAERNSLQALVLGHSWNIRRLDSQLDPTRGYAINAQISGARDEILSDRSFLRLHARGVRFQPLPSGTSYGKDMLVGVLELGVVGASSRDGIPSENLFRAGGVASLRGYGYQSLGLQKGGAIVGGRYLAIGSLEYQRRIAESYSAAAFVDYGNAGDSRGAFDPVAGYGLGVRWRTPIGPVNLDVAYGQAVSRYRIHFSIGYSF